MSDHITKRTMKVTADDKEQVVEQVHYTGWPDHGIPETEDSIEAFSTVLNDSIENAENPQGNTVYHCSAGIGRTGTLIALTQIYCQFNRYKAAGNPPGDFPVSIFSTCRKN